ncbi:MAG: hypothetical protein AB1668_07550, partial [Nanoarchaeota archaeon]
IIETNKPNMTISLDGDLIKGLENLNLDDKITLSLNVKIVNIGRDTYIKNKPLSVRAEILAGKILDNEIEEGIKEAKNLDQLEKASKKIAREK